MKQLLFFSVIFFSNAYAGFFGPSNYEECVLEGLKETNNIASTQLLHKVCTEKFKKDGSKNIISECSVTWNGNRFSAGKPENLEKYTKVVFKQTSDSIYIPTSLMSSVTQSFILKEKRKIQSICPAIVFEESDN